MSNFKVGEKVVCVSNDFIRSYSDEIFPIKGEIYTIREILSRRDGNTGLKFEEIVNPKKHYIGGFVECNFNSLKFRKLDHQFGEDVIAEIIKQVKEEELILTN